MKILSIEVSGFRMLGDDFKINLVPRAKVMERDLEGEIFEVDNRLYYFSSICFVGNNSSGKTTLLNLIYKAEKLIESGEIVYFPEDFDGDQIHLKIYFYFNKKIYKYMCSLNRPNISINVVDDRNLCVISNEKLFCKNYAGTTKMNLLNNIDTEIFPKNKENLSMYLSKAIAEKDGSKIPIFFPASRPNYELLSTFLSVRNEISPELLGYLINILDDSIEIIEPLDANKYSNDDILYKFKRRGRNAKIVSIDYLLKVLSSGTIKGMLLYLYVYVALDKGCTLIVDEIERSFHKALVDNIILLFNNSKINIHHATLIFSTHYVEIIDTIGRRDSTFVMHKNRSHISADNTYERYKFRNEISKSRRYNSNAFDTFPNYELLMKIRNTIKDEISKTREKVL